MLARMADYGANRAYHVMTGRRQVEHFLTWADGAPWFAGWGTLALVNAALAQGKNRSGLLWFLLSLLGGPLVTLVLVLLPKVRNRLF
jgi:hypothetical protein